MSEMTCFPGEDLYLFLVKSILLLLPQTLPLLRLFLPGLSSFSEILEVGIPSFSVVLRPSVK